jgi:hypothetical protein
MRDEGRDAESKDMREEVREQSEGQRMGTCKIQIHEGS